MNEIYDLINIHELIDLFSAAIFSFCLTGKFFPGYSRLAASPKSELTGRTRVHLKLSCETVSYYVLEDRYWYNW